MQKKYIVRLSADDRHHLQAVIKKLSGSSQKVRRAQILLKADAEGPNWKDRQIAEAFDCRTKTVENLRRRLVEQGFEVTPQRCQTDPSPDSKAVRWGARSADHRDASRVTPKGLG
ncbi:helix-turn-helix domain-containing protein [Nodosilinea nodulosa]|uniref:helix-turn-helix domain-containing protein n=1 Tax=Nodosilinea nodulosa TaxID=416001 RepID=UPI000302DC12|nr:helix-turn-helix domain-containing protein [Nodosilinea nodulosa]